jgi:hypothetical protein
LVLQRRKPESGVGRLRISALDGSALEIVPEDSLAEKITAERPPEEWVQDRDTRRVRVKQANEGGLRLAFQVAPECSIGVATGFASARYRAP